jgi:ferredoxin-NADP reductase
MLVLTTSNAKAFHAQPVSQPAQGFSPEASPQRGKLFFSGKIHFHNGGPACSLKELCPRGQVLMDHPTGSFTLHRNLAKTSVFIAGGIGIAPFLSIVRQTTHEGTPRRIYLFCSNRHPEDAAFLAELQELEGANPNFQFIPTMTQVPTSQQQWKCGTSYLRKDTIAKSVGELIGPLYYILGPAAMVESMRQKLRDAEVEPDDIFTDEFTGY